jgi:thymidylate kinase
MAEPTLYVVVEGFSHTGKSTLLALFNRALKDAGFTNVEMTGYDEHPHVVAEKATAQRMEELRKENNPLLGRKIWLIEKNRQRSSLDF